MMKSVVLVLITLVSLSAHSYREVVGGGGGVIEPDGRYTTFFSANIPVKAEALRAYEIGGMDFLVKKVASLDLSGNYKSLLLKQIFPSGGRNYYKVDETKLSPGILSQILSQYAKLMNVPLEKVVIYGLTDPKTKDTFLMPAFFSLTTTQQAAILFHESLWILNPALEYDQVVMAEQAVQAFFEKPESDDYFYNFYFQLGKLIGDFKLPIFPIMNRESRSGFGWARTQGQSDTIFLSELFGDNFVRCSDSAYASATMGADVQCSNSLLTELILKSQVYPKSISVRYLIDFLVGNGVISLDVPRNSLTPRNSYFYDSLRISLQNFDVESAYKTPIFIGNESWGYLNFSWKPSLH
jgi:hypothetical protein